MRGALLVLLAVALTRHSAAQSCVERILPPPFAWQDKQPNDFTYFGLHYGGLNGFADGHGLLMPTETRIVVYSSTYPIVNIDELPVGLIVVNRRSSVYGQFYPVQSIGPGGNENINAPVAAGDWLAYGTVRIDDFSTYIVFSQWSLLPQPGYAMRQKIAFSTQGIMTICSSWFFNSDSEYQTVSSFHLNSTASTWEQSFNLSVGASRSISSIQVDDACRYLVVVTGITDTGLAQRISIRRSNSVDVSHIWPLYQEFDYGTTSSPTRASIAGSTLLAMDFSATYAGLPSVGNNTVWEVNSVLDQFTLRQVLSLRFPQAFSFCGRTSAQTNSSIVIGCPSYDWGITDLTSPLCSDTNRWCNTSRCDPNGDPLYTLNVKGIAYHYTRSASGYWNISVVRSEICNSSWPDYCQFGEPASFSSGIAAVGNLTVYAAPGDCAQIGQLYLYNSTSPCETCTCADNGNCPVLQAAALNPSYCDAVLPACISQPCQHAGTCSETPGNSYSCHCAAGFSGANCDTNIDECASAPCLNGGTCVDGDSAFSCVCPAGYSGLYCQTDIDECASFPCQNGGSCHENDGGTYTCVCITGYDGNYCETAIDNCASLPCGNGGTCRDLIGSFTCVCQSGYSGSVCQTDIHECGSSPCTHGGTCRDLVASFVCTCPAGYSGLYCQTDIDECASHPCQHGGVCVDGIGSLSCSCQAGFGGTLCQIADDSNTATARTNGQIIASALAGASLVAVAALVAVVLTASVATTPVVVVGAGAAAAAV